VKCETNWNISAVQVVWAADQIVSVQTLVIHRVKLFRSWLKTLLNEMKLCCPLPALVGKQC